MRGRVRVRGRGSVRGRDRVRGRGRNRGRGRVHLAREGDAVVGSEARHLVADPRALGRRVLPG